MDQKLTDKPLDEEKDTHQGAHLDDIVGDKRTLQINCVLPSKDKKSDLGQAWQDPAGNLAGTGLPAVMLYEPEMVMRYRQAAHAADVSSLTIMFGRIANSPWYVPEFKEEQDDEG
jgi:hypothetical protein